MNAGILPALMFAGFQPASPNCRLEVCAADRMSAIPYAGKMPALP
jgi:hypothetical protein